MNVDPLEPQVFGRCCTSLTHAGEPPPPHGEPAQPGETVLEGTAGREQRGTRVRFCSAVSGVAAGGGALLRLWLSAHAGDL